MKIYKLSSPLPLDTIPVDYGETQVDELLTHDMIQELDNKYHFQEHLGSGMWGVAFSTYDGKVVKITTDGNEYVSALDFIGDGWQKNGPFVIIHEAYQLFDGLFVVVKDRVTPLNEEERLAFDMFLEDNYSPNVQYDFKMSLFNEFADYISDIQNYKQYEDTMNSGNIGRDSNGKLVAFDPRQSSFK